MIDWKKSHWLFFISFFILVSCKKPEPANITPNQEKLVKTVQLNGKTKISERLYPGKIAANQKVDLAFQVPGQIIELPIEKGKKVTTNQMLAKLDPRDFESNVKEAKAVYINAKAQFDRASNLVTKGHISKSDYDKLLSEYQKSQAKLSLAEKSLSDSVLKAPFTGIIANTFVDNYQNIQAKQKILSLQDITHVDIIVHLPEQDLIFAKQYAEQKDGSKYYVILNAVPNKKFSVKFKEITTEADSITNTYQVTLTMPTPADLTLLPGMAVTFAMKAPTNQNQETLNVPIEAVAIDEKGNRFVWIVDEEKNIVHKKIVTVGMVTDNAIQIASGLQGDERIVTAGTSLLTEGMKIKLWRDKATSRP